MNNYDKQKIKLAWANGLTVQFWDFHHETWIDVCPDDDCLSLSNSSKWRTKPKAQIIDQWGIMEKNKDEKMTDEHECVLSEKQIQQAVQGLTSEWSTDGEYITLHNTNGVIRSIEKATIAAYNAKLARREPVAWRVWLEDLQMWSYSNKYHGCGDPLYVSPNYCPSPK